jgi:hypothetical protein
MGYLGRLQNPIAQRELAHQQQNARLFGSLRLQAVYRVVYYPALALALTIFLSELGAALQPGDEHSAALVLNAAAIFALVVAVLMQLYLLLQTLVRAAASVAREKQAGIWEDLILTGTDSRRLILGKWWATLRTTLGGFALLIPLRAGVVVWLGAVFDRSQLLNIEAVSTYIAPGALAFFATIPVIAMFTLGSALLIAAAGILASTLSRSLVQALALACLLAGLIFGGTFGLLSAVHLATAQDAARSPEWHSSTSSFSENMLITWLDNGMTLTSELVGYQTQYDSVSRQYVADSFASNKASAWLLTFITCTGLYLALTWIMLRLAQTCAVRQGALPPQRRRGVVSTMK